MDLFSMGGVRMFAPSLTCFMLALSAVASTSTSAVTRRLEKGHGSACTMLDAWREVNPSQTLSGNKNLFLVVMGMGSGREKSVRVRGDGGVVLRESEQVASTRSSLHSFRESERERGRTFLFVSLFAMGYRVSNAAAWRALEGKAKVNGAQRRVGVGGEQRSSRFALVLLQNGLARRHSGSSASFRLLFNWRWSLLRFAIWPAPRSNCWLIAHGALAMRRATFVMLFSC